MYCPDVVAVVDEFMFVLTAAVPPKDPSFDVANELITARVSGPKKPVAGRSCAPWKSISA